MKGKVLNYNIQESKGIISADDGKRYNFTNSEWKGEQSPAANQTVDFEVDGENAKGIYLIKSSANFDGVTNVNNIEKAKGFSEYLSVVSKNGIQNKFGFFISILLAIFMFIPIAKQSNLIGGFHQISLYIFSETPTIYAFICIMISAGFYYIGAKQILVKLTVIIYTIFLIFASYELYNLISTYTSMYHIHLEMYILLLLLIFNISVAFSKSYKEASLNN